MPERLLHHHYEEWPPDRQERESLAREVFGERIVSGAYDTELNWAANVLFHGHRPKSLTEEEQKYHDWIASLRDEERDLMFAFIRSMLEGVMFAILTEFGATTWPLLEGEVREQLRVAVEFTRLDRENGWAAEGPVEVITINSRESLEKRGIELHRLWFDWKERYSRWQGEVPRGEEQQHRDPTDGM